MLAFEAYSQLAWSECSQSPQLALDRLLSADWIDLADKSGKDALLLTYLLHYKWSILAGVIPRLCTTGFRFAQPFLVQRVLSFLDGPDESNNVGYGLIGAYVVVYIGLAVCRVLNPLEPLQLTRVDRSLHLRYMSTTPTG